MRSAVSSRYGTQDLRAIEGGSKAPRRGSSVGETRTPRRG
jgi:hypothetical protein